QRQPRKRTPRANEFFQENGAARACLNLQPVFWRRHDRERGWIPGDHRGFVAAIEPGTLITVFMNLVGKILMISVSESQTREKFRNASEQTDAADFVLFRLRKQRLHQPSAAAVALARGIDGN